MARAKRKPTSKTKRAAGEPSTPREQIRELRAELAGTKRALEYAYGVLRCAPSERQQDEDRVKATGLAGVHLSRLLLMRPPGVSHPWLNPGRLRCGETALVYGWGRGTESRSGRDAETSAMNAAVSESQDRARKKVQAAIDAVRCQDGCPKRLAAAIRLEIVDRESTFDGSKARATALCFSWAIVVCQDT
jgi:hypothetical protein